MSEPDGTEDVFETQLRVRYDEADPMGFVHHANYFRYFEICRVEKLRSAGGSYKAVEASGQFVVVVRAEVKFREPARYDDLLTIHLRVGDIGRAKVEHVYWVTREGKKITDAKLTLAVLGRDGSVIRVPDWMRPDAAQD